MPVWILDKEKCNFFLDVKWRRVMPSQWWSFTLGCSRILMWSPRYRCRPPSTVTPIRLSGKHSYLLKLDTEPAFSFIWSPLGQCCGSASEIFGRIRSGTEINVSDPDSLLCGVTPHPPQLTWHLGHVLLDSCDTLHLLIVFRTWGNGYSLCGFKK